MALNDSCYKNYRNGQVLPGDHQSDQIEQGDPENKWHMRILENVDSNDVMTSRRVIVESEDPTRKKWIDSPKLFRLKTY